MKATAFEFRFRLLFIFGIIALGFWAPWLYWADTLHLGSRSSTWLWLGFQLGGLGIFSSTAIELVTGAAILSAALGAVLRVWGTAYLGTHVVYDGQMQDGAETKPGMVLADGPYRFVRNPLYLGSLLTNAAVAVLMPPSGAAFTLILLVVLYVRLILGEEAFLTAKLGGEYNTYRQSVPRLIPSFRTSVKPGGQRPHWGAAVLGEIFPLGILVSFAALSWQYNSQQLTQAVLVSFGLSLVVRALTAPKSSGGEKTA